MQYIPALLLAAMAAASPLAMVEKRAGPQLNLVNHCGAAIYYNQGNNAAKQLNAGATASVPLSGSAQAYKLGRTADAAFTNGAVEVEFNIQGNTDYYALSLQKGNPFRDQGQTLAVSDSSCYQVRCNSGQFPCPGAYNTQADNSANGLTHTCASSASLTFTACSGGA